MREETGLELQVLSGEEESKLTFLAVRRWFGWSSGRLLVADILRGLARIAGAPSSADSTSVPGPCARA